MVKIDPATLPRQANIHYLGARSYDQLPHYLSGWGVALIAFQLNESARFISPTKTPEYLAGGKPVVSTPIWDVVRPYGGHGLVAVGRDSEEFIGLLTTLTSPGHLCVEWHTFNDELSGYGQSPLALRNYTTGGLRTEAVPENWQSEYQ